MDDQACDACGRSVESRAAVVGERHGRMLVACSIAHMAKASAKADLKYRAEQKEKQAAAEREAKLIRRKRKTPRRRPVRGRQGKGPDLREVLGDD